MRVETTDYHTAGEPFRIVTAGAPEIPGATVAERRERALVDDAVQTVRRLLCHEPRGHADMYGGFLVPPDDDGADLGVLFWHKDGFSTACGHGTIALAAWAVESGRVAAPDDGTVDVTIDVPSGRVVGRVTLRGGAIEEVGFRNVPSVVLGRSVAVGGGVTVDLAYGGAIYAAVPAGAFQLRVAQKDLPSLIMIARAIKAELADTDVYGVIFWEELERLDGAVHQRNVTVFADGEVDRSPCGSGTSARLALLDLDAGAVLWHESIVGTMFAGRVLGETPDGILTEVVGQAFKTGEHVFTLDPRDPVGTGFVLR